jgi:hypothetical protein
VKAFWQILKQSVDVDTNQSCGTHVHVSLTSRWTLRDIQQLSKAVLWFEPSFQAIVPPHRRNNIFCKAFTTNNPEFVGKTIQECLKLIEAKEDYIQVADLMNPDRYYSVNFQNLYYGRTGTVEFRMAPASKRPKEVLAWIDFAIAFTRASIKVDKLSQYGRNVGGLKLFLRKGDLKGVTRPELRSPIFENLGNSFRVDPSPLGPLSPEEQAIFEAKKAQDLRRQVQS